MALGALTAATPVGQEGGPISIFQLSFLGDDSYPTGGTVGFDALARAALGKGNVEILSVTQNNLSDHVVRYVPADGGTLQAQLMATGAPVANAVDLSGITFELTVIAR